jgi:hypothetical protein
MTNDDLEVILALPQEHGKSYFDMLCYKDTMFFKAKKMAEIDPVTNMNYSLVDDIWEVWIKAKKVVEGNLFRQEYD